MPVSSTVRLRLLPKLIWAAVLVIPHTTFSQELRSVLQSDDVSLDVSEKIDNSAELVLSSFPSDADAIAATETETETVRERFQDSKIRIEREVALDSEQNYVNHGKFTEWSASGEIVASGGYQMGLRQGAWIRFHQAKDSSLFSTQPYASFKAPFQSSVDFKDDKMDGLWVVTDADHRVVTQIQLVRGIRHGKANWFHTNGTSLYEAQYSDGVLDGDYIERSADGKVVRQEQHVNGSHAETETEYYPSKAIKSELSFLSPPKTVATHDDWDLARLATYSTVGEKLKHGTHKTYFDNGRLKAVTNYDHGSLSGSYQSWYANGEKAVSGKYVADQQDGKWNWWHENGMRKAIANYKQGKAEGETLAWSDSGKRITATNLDVNTDPEEGPVRIAPAKIPRLR